MIIHQLKITNFKSIYGTQTFNFDNLKGLIKLSGPIGAGKTTIAEAILWGLYGTVKGQNNGQLISWNAKACEIEINLTSKNKKDLVWIFSQTEMRMWTQELYGSN